MHPVLEFDFHSLSVVAAFGRVVGSFLEHSLSEGSNLIGRMESFITSKAGRLSLVRAFKQRRDLMLIIYLIVTQNSYNDVDMLML